MKEEWKPPCKMSNGSYEFYDWLSIRAAIQAAYKEQGLAIPESIDPHIWNMVGLALDYNRFTSRHKCAHCECLIPTGKEIRCLDCKSTLCERCAPVHFWPDGRPR